MRTYKSIHKYHSNPSRPTVILHLTPYMPRPNISATPTMTHSGQRGLDIGSWRKKLFLLFYFLQATIQTPNCNVKRRNANTILKC